MALIMATPISKQQLDPSGLCLMSHGTFKISSRCLRSALSDKRGRLLRRPRVPVSISRVSDLRRIILYSRWRVGTPTRRPLEVSLRWHLSVSGQPSVAPSISLADSRELGASLYSFTSSAGHCPAGTRPGPFSRTLPNTLMEHTHTHTGKHFTESHSPWTRLEK